MKSDSYSRKEHLAKDIVQKQQLDSSRQVGIYAVLSHEFVMFNVITLSPGQQEAQV